ncbi:neprilysin-like [Ornithodoros turicata]|uniref:neprilysin-like n=1 Tax=Ornithodoros turicata TaxID=34597 RepID=UPI0031386C8F
MPITGHPRSTRLKYTDHETTGYPQGRSNKAPTTTTRSTQGTGDLRRSYNRARAALRNDVKVIYIKVAFYVLLYYGFVVGVRIVTNFAFPECINPVTCVDLDTELAVSMRPELDPCENFYDFVCGHWKANYPRSPNQFDLLQKRLDTLLLEDISKNLDPDSVIGKMGIGLQKCMDVVFKKENNNDVLSKFFDSHKMKWPTRQTMPLEDLLDLLVGLSLEDFVGIFFQLDDAPYLRTDDRYVVMVVAGNAAPYLTANPIGIMSRCMNSFRETSHRVAERVAEIEKDFIAISWTHRPYDDIPHFDTYATLDKITGPRLNGSAWLKAINSRLPRGTAFTRDDELFFKDRYALTAFKDMVAKYDVSDLLLFIGWRIVFFLSSAVSYNLVSCQLGNAHWRFYFVRSFGRCKWFLKVVAPYAILHLELDSVVQSPALAYVDDLAGSLRTTYETAFNHSWMDETSSRGAVTRLRAIKQVVGWPEHLRTGRDLEKYYSHVPRFHDRPFIESLLDSYRAKTIVARKLFALGSSMIRREEDYELSQLTANAVYVSVFHLIVIPASILLPPFLQVGEADALNFGSLGKILGHEFMHAFDPNWARVSKSGDILRWYTDATRDEYVKRVNCIVNQVNKATGSKTLGQNSVDESFADVVGSHAAYLAYKMAVKHPEQSKIAGISHDEAFFASGCLLLCSDNKTYYSLGEGYPPTEVRCHVPFMNMKEFAQVFNCPRGSPMRIQNRCVLLTAT